MNVASLHVAGDIGGFFFSAFFAQIAKYINRHSYMSLRLQSGMSSARLSIVLGLVTLSSSPTDLAREVS